MKRKLLLTFLPNLNNTTEMIQSALFLQENFNYEIEAIYIKSVKSLIMPPQIGLGSIHLSTLEVETNKIENIEIEEIKRELFNSGIYTPLNVDAGYPDKVIFSKLMEVDLLLLGTNNYLNENLISILKGCYRPVFLINKKPISFENIFFSNDEGIKANKSLFSFLNMFPHLTDYNVIFFNRSKNDESTNVDFLRLKDKEISIEYHFELDDFYSSVDKSSLVIMGNLSRSYFFKNVTKRIGLNILEKCSSPIFIGF